MRFEFTSNETESVLRAVFEDGDRHEGSRQEGPGQTITYSGTDITFDYPVRSIHPDLLGLLCLIVFYPFIGERAVFPMPVSPRLEQAFQNQNFRRRFRFDNVDPGVEAYSGSRLALSFGGGIDSSAVCTMFPDAYVVHEAHIKDGRLVPSHAHQIVQDLGPDRGRVVATNQRYVSRPGGWHGWTCAAAAALLMATDNDFGMILMGTILGATLLANGSVYWDRFQARERHGFTGNFWQSAFNAVGMPMFSPVCGASEFLTMTLSLDLIKAGRVVYCMEQDGRPCLRCSKCLRRDMIRAVVDPSHHPDWKPYDSGGHTRIPEHQAPVFRPHLLLRPGQSPRPAIVCHLEAAGRSGHQFRLAPAGPRRHLRVLRPGLGERHPQAGARALGPDGIRAHGRAPELGSEPPDPEAGPDLDPTARPPRPGQGPASPPSAVRGLAGCGPPGQAADSQGASRMRATRSWPKAVITARYIRPVTAITAWYPRSRRAAAAAAASPAVAIVQAAQNQPSSPL